jgi:hypothetical protein
MKFMFQVSRDHIRRANMTSTHTCVLGLALYDALPLASEVSIGINMGHIVHASSYPTLAGFHLPEEAIRFIRFMIMMPRCLRWMVRPRSFEIEVPDHFVAVEPERSARRAAELTTTN